MINIKLNPSNPRIIKDAKFQALVKSVKEFPEMAEVRKVVVNKEGTILGGNMRYRAMLEAGRKDIPTEIVDWSEEKQKRFIILDNLSYGDWDYDIMANDYDLSELEDMGMDLPDDLRGDKPPRLKDLITCPECNHHFTQ